MVQGKQLDQAGSAASILCAIHCGLSPLVLPLLPLAHLLGPTLEWAFVAISLILGISSLAHSYRAIHRDALALTLFSIGFFLLVIVRALEPRGIVEHVGVFASATLIIAAHTINLRLRRTSRVSGCGCPCHDDHGAERRV